MEPLLELALLLIDDGRYEKAHEILIELKNWPEVSAVKDMMPVVEFHLVRVIFKMQNYEVAAIQFENWLLVSKHAEAYYDFNARAYCFLGWSYYILAEGKEASAEEQELYHKALEAFKHIKENYTDSVLFGCAEADIEKMIETCAAKIE